MPLDTFSLIFNDNVLNAIVTFTNLHEQTIGSKWFRAYIGLLIEAGMHKQGLYDYDDF